jgi:hypothetical protein
MKNDLIYEFLCIALGVTGALIWFVSILACVFLIPDNPWVFVPLGVFLISTGCALISMWVTGRFNQ